MNLSVYTKEFAYNLKLAYPIILAMLGHTIVGVIDNIMVGQIGPTELAAASLANSFVFIAISIGVGFSTAITPLVASSIDNKDVAAGRKIFMSGLLLCTILGFVLFGMLYSMQPLLEYMQQPTEVIEMAKPFLKVIGFSLVPLVIFQAYKQYADGKSQTKYSMYATILANVVNIGVNYLLIYGIWIFPEMGMMGVAYGTLIARFSMLIYMHFALKSKTEFKPILSNLSLKDIDKFICERIYKIGLPSSMQSMFEVVLFTGAVWLSGMLGTASQAANQIALSMVSMTFMFASGLGVASMIRVGNQRGYKDYKQLRIVAISIILMTILVYIIFALFFVLFHGYIPLFFLDIHDAKNALLNQEVIEIAGKLLLIAAIFQISDGVQVTVLGSLRGMQDVNIPTLITFISYWIIGFPIAIYLGLYTNLKAEGIWYGLLAGLTAAAIFSYLRFNYMTKKLIHLQQAQA